MANLDFSKLTPDNGAVKDLRQLIFLACSDVDSLGAIFNFLPKQKHGNKVGFVGDFSLIGKKAQGCKPKYGNNILTASEKTWDIQEWEIAEEICYKDLEGTLAQIAMRSGTNISDLTGTEYIDDILDPKLQKAIRKLLMRLAWFGDKSAATITDGGVLKDDVNPEYFNITDGFWKRLFAITAADPKRRTTIAANAKTTFSEQDAAMNTPGAATDFMHALITNASQVLREADGGIIYITMALKDALDWDITKNNKGSELQWNAMFDGIQKTTYKGVEVAAIPFFDEIIQNYETVTGGKSWNKPYRALYTIKDNLLVGSESESEIAGLKIWFSEDDQVNRILGKDKLGTLVAQDDMVQVGY